MMAFEKWALRLAASLSLVAICSAAAGPQPGIAVAWGDDSSGQTEVPASATNVVGMAGGGLQSLALNADGTVVGWGSYFDGSNTVPVVGVPEVTSAAAVAAGGDHCLALRSNGTVVAWGTYYTGSAWASMPVPTGLTNITAIAAGGFQSLALRSNGTVAAWGTHFNGTNYGPVTVPAGLTSVMAIAAGNAHCLALKSNRSVVAWGSYFNGSAWLPMAVPAGLTNVAAIAAGSYSALALKSNGTVTGWGTYFDGTAYLPATNTPAGLTNVSAIAAGGFQSLALKTDQSLAAWGSYYNGSNWGPVTVPAGLSNVTAIAAGYYHSLAITLEPLILTPLPVLVSLAYGAATNLAVSVWSQSPYTCQWALNGTPIATATTTTLALSDFDASQAGTYSVLISNLSAQTTLSSIVRLTNSPLVLVDGVAVAGGNVDRTNGARITLSGTSGPGAHLYFTLDGTAPDLTASPYTGPFILTNSASIRAMTYNSTYTEWAEAAVVNLKIWPLYPLTATTLGGGSLVISPPASWGSNLYVSNTLVTLTAVAADGWSVMGWTGDSTTTSNLTTVLMDRPRKLQAVFGSPINLLILGNGQVTPTNGMHAYGSTVRLTARPGSNYYFFGWADAASGAQNPLDYFATIPSPGITALFGALKPNQVSLTVLPTSGGSVSNSTPQNVYTNGDAITLTAVATSNYVFAGWAGDASGTTNPLALTLNSSKVITANFVPYAPTNLPLFTQSPLSRTMAAGSDTTLSVQVTSDGPFALQWRFNGSPLAGGTNATLVLHRVSALQAGLYDVVATNAAGTATSTAASVALLGLELVSDGMNLLPMLILDGAPGTSYRLESASTLPSTNAPATNWGLIAPITLVESQLYYVTTPVTNHARQFYRAVPQ